MNIISVDLQKDFSAEGGYCYRPRPCVDFIKSTFIPHLRKFNTKIAEIISDYRLPRPHEKVAYCVPGETGYESEIPEDVKYPQVWIKCMNSPIWVRENGGVADKPPGDPYQDPHSFSAWLHETIGRPCVDDEVILIGLTLDCCVLCTAQELFFRGYNVKFLVEGVDTSKGTREEKERILEKPLSFWGSPITWETVRKWITSQKQTQ